MSSKRLAAISAITAMIHHLIFIIRSNNSFPKKPQLIKENASKATSALHGYPRQYYGNIIAMIQVIKLNPNNNHFAIGNLQISF